MKKNITKEQIIDTVLELLKDNNNVERLNFREIARTLGCAHTNLYNYFPSYKDLLWESHSAILLRFINTLHEKLDVNLPPKNQLTVFFEIIINMYMDNQGWFRLSWHEYIKGNRPEKDINMARTANDILNNYAMQICNNLFEDCPDKNTVKQVLHNTHCYIIGEISNYLLDRGIIKDEQLLRKYMLSESVSMFQFCLLGKQQNGVNL